MTQPDEDRRASDGAIDVVSQDPEAPEADALDQARPANQAGIPVPVRMPLEANEADVVEQSQLVGDDPDEDYR